jgi:hypothetical protein
VIENGDPEASADPMALKQGDLALLESEVARRLLSSHIHARFCLRGDGRDAAGSGDVVSLDG